MAGSSKDGDDGNEITSIESSETEKKSTKKKKKGWFSRIFNALFRSRRDDFEKRLEHISKEEAAVLARIRKRAQSWRRIIRNFILLAVLLEVVAVVYAIMTTRTMEMHWKIRAFKVLPMFLLPGLSFLTYSALSSLNSMFVRKDEKTLERLRSERQAKINELKEKTNYYITQQLIQRYDPDPAAKAAAASVLASKLGADSGLKVYLGDDSQSTAPTGKSADIEVVPSDGLHNRKKGQGRASSTDSTVLHPHEDELQHQRAPGGTNISPYQQLVVEHHPQNGGSPSDGGWLARIAALLVGEDPTQSYALICGNCNMHNGLARKEDFPYITYYCPHCKALNRPKELDQRISELNSAHLSTSTTATDMDSVKAPLGLVPSAPSAPSVPSANSTTTGAASTTETGQVISDEQVG